ncbi:hypothetical protein GC093_16745 [Paenibacillus sp. LMG 31456]|uniref:SLH domain-containing protein n=1 Tax=Paenibacillus foliorum TaxID=2654974 RepID=A0A972GQ51_9BACL|nr:leucine-rich repeat domain-containing protein [Paenibacillus foliorum]NOU94856.1 hypothetical protein [Paenibacillus foliorum]
MRSMKRTNKLLVSLAVIGSLLCSGNSLVHVNASDSSNEIVNFPDANLKKALLNIGVDTSGDGNITRGELAARSDSLGMGNGMGSLNLGNQGITNLTGLEYAVNVTSIALNKNKISDLSPLAKLNKLESIGLGFSNITDLSPLANLTGVRLLTLEGNGISDLSPLATMSGLEYLYLQGNKISDIRPLAKLNNLKIIQFFNNAISDISPLSNLSSLREVNLVTNKVSDISPLARLKGLQILYLSENTINDISPLSNLTGLKELHLDFNTVSDVSPLANLTGLQNLLLDDNRINNVAPLAKLIRLEDIGLNKNEISDVSPLRNLTNLKKLYLPNNKIRDLSPLSQLTDLKELVLSNNDISNIAELSKLINLKSLGLSKNKIVDTSPLSQLIGLKELSLDDNQVSDVTPLSKLMNLEILWLTNNPIRDLSPLSKLNSLRDLRTDDSNKSTIEPTAKGVSDGGFYNTDRVITYDKGTAMLNNKPFANGGTVSEEGGYTLDIIDKTGIVTSIHFIIDKTPPVVTGVSSEGVYDTDTIITFNEGTATLNGKSFSSSGKISADGEYILVVTDQASNRVTINFTLNRAAPGVRGVSDGGFYNTDKVITFEQGTATLNDKPFSSGDKVSEDGTYTLVVTGMEGKRTTIRFSIYKIAPVVTGVSVGGTYNSAKVITFDHGTATLNDQPFKNGDMISDSGAYKLVVTDKAGNRTTIEFTIKIELRGASDWAKADLLSASEIGLTQPVRELIFTKDITREQFSEIAVKLYEVLKAATVPQGKDNPFKDTVNPEILKAYQLGIVIGTAADQFSPDALITREQLATMLKRVLDRTELTISKGKSVEFADQGGFSSYAADSIDFMSSIDVIKGITENTFGSKQNATIEQAVIMAKRMHDKTAPLKKVDTKKQPEAEPAATTNTFDGNLFELYIHQSHPQPDGSKVNYYGFFNKSSFTLPSYSAIYVTAGTSFVKFEEDHYNYHFGGKVVVANHSSQPKVFQVRDIDYTALQQIYRDNMGTVTRPDGTPQILTATGPYIRMISFKGDFDESKPYANYINEKKDLFVGDWMTVRMK